MKPAQSSAEILTNLQARRTAMQSGTSGMLTTAELCSLLSVTKQTISAWAAKRTIPHFRLGTLLRFDPQQLITWVEERQV